METRTVEDPNMSRVDYVDMSRQDELLAFSKTGGKKPTTIPNRYKGVFRVELSFHRGY